jgi:hypothetical protein
VERLTKTDLACAVASAAAHELNNELTVILNCVSCSIPRLEPGHPARPDLLELQRAALRCVGKTSGLLRFGANAGSRPVRASLESLLGK